MTKAQEIKARTLIKALDFDGLAEALERVDNVEMVTMIIDRMFELDETRAIEFSENY